jgi:hypothetical protein
MIINQLADMTLQDALSPHLIDLCNKLDEVQERAHKIDVQLEQKESALMIHCRRYL